jgi:hypothetical protein
MGRDLKARVLRSTDDHETFSVEAPFEHHDGTLHVTVEWSDEDERWIAALHSTGVEVVFGTGLTQIEALADLSCALLVWKEAA